MLWKSKASKRLRVERQVMAMTASQGNGLSLRGSVRNGNGTVTRIRVMEGSSFKLQRNCIASQ